MATVDKEIALMQQRMDQMDKKLDKMDEKLDNLVNRGLWTTISATFRRLVCFI